MPRSSFVLRNGDWVEKYSPLDVRPARARSHLPCPMLIRDEITPLQGQHDGKTYDSKSALYRSYKDKGVRIIETGETHGYQEQPKKPMFDDVKQAYDMVVQGYKPPPLESGIIPVDSE